MGRWFDDLQDLGFGEVALLPGDPHAHPVAGHAVVDHYYFAVVAAGYPRRTVGG